MQTSAWFIMAHKHGQQPRTLQEVFEGAITGTDRNQRCPVRHGKRFEDTLNCVNVNAPPVIVMAFPDQLRAGDVVIEIPMDMTVTVHIGNTFETYIIRGVTMNPPG